MSSNPNPNINIPKYNRNNWFYRNRWVIGGTLLGLAVYRYWDPFHQFHKKTAYTRVADKAGEIRRDVRNIGNDAYEAIQREKVAPRTTAAFSASDAAMQRAGRDLRNFAHEVVDNNIGTDGSRAGREMRNIAHDIVDRTGDQLRSAGHTLDRTIDRAAEKADEVVDRVRRS